MYKDPSRGTLKSGNHHVWNFLRPDTSVTTDAVIQTHSYD